MWLELLRDQVSQRGPGGLGAVAAELGYSKSALSLVLNGKYDSSTARIEAAVLRTFEERDLSSGGSAIAPLPLPGPSTTGPPARPVPTTPIAKEPPVFERLKTLLKPVYIPSSPHPRVAIRSADRAKDTVLLGPSKIPVAMEDLYRGHAYLSMAFACREAIGLMTDITSMETAQSAMTELVRRGMHLEPIDWLLLEQYRGDPIPTLAQLQAAFRERLIVLGFTSVTQTVP